MAIIDDVRERLRDRYEILDEVGQGGMATVYLAKDIRHDREVAVKVLRPELAAALGAERFVREIKIAAKLQHPHILPLLDSGDAGGILYYVMPFIKGESLRDRLDKSGELPIGDAVRILREVADALAHAHETGLVHRDIKPDNVMLSGRHVMVMDFGVAKALDEAKNSQQLTTAGVALGTPAYMAPEQATADPNTDHRADIYALGAMGYELLTGRPPFSGQTAQQILSAHVTQEVDPVSKWRSSVPPDLENLIQRCLQKLPADRFQTAEELHGHLESLSTTSGGLTPIQTRPISAVGPATRARNRNAAIIAAAVVGAGALAAAGFLLKGDGAPAVVAVPPERQVTFSGDVQGIAITPDGQTIAYTVDDAHSIQIQDLQGGGTSTIFTHPDPQRGVNNVRLYWSSDGTRLFFATRIDEVSGIYSVPKLGGSPTLVYDFEPLPDGTLLTFFRPAADDRWIFAIGPTIHVGSARGELRVADGVLEGDWETVAVASDLVLNAELSPDGQWIAYSGLNRTFEDAVNGIISMDGETVTPLGGIFELGLGFSKWAPDGRGVYFTRPAQGRSELVLLEFDPRRGTVGEPRVVHPRLPDEFPGQPDMSGDRRTFAYVAAETRSNLRLLHLDGSESTEMLTRGTANYSNGVFSPDGETVFYARAPLTMPDGEMLYLSRPVSGGDERTLATVPSTNLEGLSISPDGSRLASYELELATSDIVPRLAIVNTANGRRTVLPVEGLMTSTEWLPDGERILHTAFLPSQDSTEVVYIKDVSDGSTTTLQLQCDTGCGFDGERIAMSPEWPFAAISSDDDLWVVNLDDGSLRSLAHEVWYPYRWTADNWIYFGREPGDRDNSDLYGVYRIRPDGTGLELVMDIPEDCSSDDFSISPDGTLALCTVQESEPDVRIADLN